MAKHSMSSGDNHPNPFQQFGAKMRRGRSSLLLEEAHPELQRLVEALRDIDDSAGTDKASLIDVIKTTGGMNNKLLADLLERCDLVLKKKGKGAPRRPAYVTTSDVDLLLSQAEALLCELLAENWTLDAAIKHAVKVYGVTQNQLVDFHAGRTRSLRNL
jgi:hypothetical protein